MMAESVSACRSTGKSGRLLVVSVCAWTWQGHATER